MTRVRHPKSRANTIEVPPGTEPNRLTRPSTPEEIDLWHQLHSVKLKRQRTLAGAIKCHKTHDAIFIAGKREEREEWHRWIKSKSWWLHRLLGWPE
jgi:hypothetical protein